MGCLVKAGIRGNKNGLWSETIFVHTEQLETENQKKTAAALHFWTLKLEYLW